MERLSDIASALRQDKGRAGLLLRVGAGGALLIVAWDQVGSLFLPVFAVVPVALLLTFTYAGVITMLITGAVQAANRRQFEAALQSERLLTRGRQRAVEGASPNDSAEATFHQAYFLIRLEEEVKRARREGYELSLICLDVSVPGHKPEGEVLEAICYDVATLVSGQEKTISLAGCLAPTVFVLCLPRTDARAARAFLSKCLQGLGSYWCQSGLATYPGDATNSSALLECAWQSCEQTATAAS